ncbi:SCO family protein [Aminobacter anthyllidis]|uniref:SCO family protein n=1 Tax=Aminobacter anthyllidis TaxID=1035067 RepID=A0A9X1D9A6_9HYPH|nr:SCO family protein [Aminobacter anthyllidis]MBT1160249.1 SCO family protein [Aminobacter anthyllidis]
MRTDSFSAFFHGLPDALVARKTTRLLARLAAALVLVAALATAVSAHSLDEVETMIGGNEKYFQPIDKPAPDFTLRTADGRTVQLADLRGKVVVLNFIYTSCPDVCPLHAEKIAEVQKLVNDTPMKDRVTFVMVTTDPSNDTADVLRSYGPAHGLDPVNWLFLTTIQDEPEDTTRKLAESFGHKFTKTDDGYQMHGIVTHVIDGDGTWKANFHGLKFDTVNLVTFVNALTNGTTRSHPHSEKNWWDLL